jgi:arylsulfatase
MAHNIGWFDIGAYHQDLMAGRTPNLDKLERLGVVSSKPLKSIIMLS